MLRGFQTWELLQRSLFRRSRLNNTLSNKELRYEYANAKNCFDHGGSRGLGRNTAESLSRKGIWAEAGVLRAWVKKYGIPVALYTDWKNVYVREGTKEQFQGAVPVTQFGQICQRLGIRIIAANSPQAEIRHGNPETGFWNSQPAERLERDFRRKNK